MQIENLGIKNLKLKRIKTFISIKQGHNFYTTGCSFITLDSHGHAYVSKLF